MNHLFAYLAGGGSAVCYGVATVLEQIGARQADRVNRFNPKFLWNLLHKGPFLFGTFLDTLGWLLSLAAVRELPLFLAQSFIAASLVISTLIDRYYLKTVITDREKFALGTITGGLMLLAITAVPHVSHLHNPTFRDFLIISPVFLAMAGVLLINYRMAKQNTILMVVIAGLAFSGTNIAARVSRMSHLGFHTLLEPTVLVLIAYGIIGTMLMSIALQRDSVSRLNGALFATEVAVPSVVGIFFLDDRIRSGFAGIAAFGIFAVVVGTLIMGISDNSTSSNELPT
jgi:hypothetical protein